MGLVRHRVETERRLMTESGHLNLLSFELTLLKKRAGFVVQFNKSGAVDPTHFSQYVVSVNSTGNDFETMS